MSTSNPNIYLAKNLEGLNFQTKEIKGVNYRINNFNFKDLNIRLNKSGPNNGNRIRTRDEKMINLDQIKNILSDDDKTSDDEYSENFSFDEDENDEDKKQNTEKSNHNNIDINDPDIILATKELNSDTANQNWTHFIAIPFNKFSNNNELVEKFNYYKNKIIEEEFVDINESLFQFPERLHMTLCMLELKNTSEVNKVQKILKEKILPEIKEFLKNEEIYSFFDSFEVFGKPHESRVLFAKPKNNNTDRLYDVLDILFSNLVENKILNQNALQYSNIILNKESDRFEKEKLHLTIMNSTFAYRENLKNNSNTINIQDLISGANKKKSNNLFNGMRIIRRFNNFYFGSHKINEICLFEMKIDNKTNNYKILDSIKLS